VFLKLKLQKFNTTLSICQEVIKVKVGIALIIDISSPTIDGRSQPLKKRMGVDLMNGFQFVTARS